jgi:predicted nucleic acid-binding Zn ribbon protein
MDFDEQFSLEHLLFKKRKCRSCGEAKDLIDGFYLIRKDRGMFPSSYSYECKECTIKRVVVSRMTNKVFDRWEYPDW